MYAGASLEGFTMTGRIVAALLAAAALVPGVAAAQGGQHRGGRGQQQADGIDGQRQARQQYQAQREARADRRDDRQQANTSRNRAADQRQRVARQNRNNDGRPKNQRPQAPVRVLHNGNDQRRTVANRDYRGANAYRARPTFAANDYRRSWNNNWRQDRRYDWNSYRNYNRGAFHLPRYYAPYGGNYGYRRLSIGIRLAAPLFGENYWIDDPYDYRLPAAYGPYRWVRYYGDAILVDVRSGSVVDVIHDIFW